MPKVEQENSKHVDNLKNRKNPKCKGSDVSKGASRQARFFRRSADLDCAKSGTIGDELEQPCNRKINDDLEWTEFGTGSSGSTYVQLFDTREKLDCKKFRTNEELSIQARLRKARIESREATLQAINTNLGHANDFKNRLEPT